MTDQAELSERHPPLRSDTAYQAILHRAYHADRRRIIAALITAADGDPDPKTLDTPHPCRKLAHKLASCGRAAVIAEETDTGVLRTEQARCRSRLCPLCSKLRALDLERSILATVTKIDSPGFITLTLASSSDPLSKQIDRLIAAARRLRQRAQWKIHVRGGIQVVEITYNTRTNTWHPHLHVLADLIYWPQKQIAREWLAVTGDSRIVDVRRIASKHAIARYVAKYTSKGSDARSIPARRLAEWASAIHGRRMAQPFGVLHGTRTGPVRKPTTGTWRIRTYLAALIEAAKAGSKSASEILHDLRALPRIENPATASPDAIAAHRRLGDVLRHWRFDDPDPEPKPPPPPPRVDPQVTFTGFLDRPRTNFV